MNTAIIPTTADFDAVLRRALNCSRYVQRLLDSDTQGRQSATSKRFLHPAGVQQAGCGVDAGELLPWLRAHYAQPCNAAEMEAWLDAMPITDEESLSRALRRLRKRVMLKLLTRDLGGLADLDEVMACMTALAELAVRRAQTFVMQSLVAQYGQPMGALSGTPQELLVIGMGKLGGGELNVSSDIDLIFVYPEDGDTNGSRSISNHEFFSKLGRRLISLIHEPTGEGYVFRVDMRLRPYGDSGPLAMSYAALEEYLVAQGREWERYAWIKARVISPADCPATKELMQLTQPFVFRKYLDFGAFASMRKLHAQIRQEVQRRDRLNNIKLGPGGIREIEFIAQVFQLIRGGRDAHLRTRPTLQVLQLLRESGQLTPETVAELSAAYIFLRNLEHRLQYLDDQQTQDLPENPGDQALVAAGMGYPDYSTMLEQLSRHRALVSEQFAQIFSTQEYAEPDNTQQDSTLWCENMHVEEVRDGLDKLGYADAMNLAERLLRCFAGSGCHRKNSRCNVLRSHRGNGDVIGLCSQ
jgi:glutamate-ammonia-ligase adenylyltransferase